VKQVSRQGGESDVIAHSFLLYLVTFLKLKLTRKVYQPQKLGLRKTAKMK
jgi:hypothetical protein